MAKSMGGDLVLQLLHESREHQQDYKHFKREMLEFKHEMLEFKHEMLEFREDYKYFKREMLEFKHEMLSFKQFAEHRMDLLHQGLAQTHDYLKLLVKMVQDMGDVRQRVNQHDEQLADHEE